MEGSGGRHSAATTALILGASTPACACSCMRGSYRVGEGRTSVNESVSAVFFHVQSSCLLTGFLRTFFFPFPSSAPHPFAPHPTTQPTTGSAAVGAVAGGFVVAAALSDHPRRRDKLPVSDGSITRSSTYASAFLSAAASVARAAAAAAATKPSDLSSFLGFLRSSEWQWRSTTERRIPPPLVVPGVLSSIGNTPMMRVASLSDATGCDVLIKCEFANPGGSVKDRVALGIIQEALQA